MCSSRKCMCVCPCCWWSPSQTILVVFCYLTLHTHTVIMFDLFVFSVRKCIWIHVLIARVYTYVCPCCWSSLSNTILVILYIHVYIHMRYVDTCKYVYINANVHAYMLIFTWIYASVLTCVCEHDLKGTKLQTDHYCLDLSDKRHMCIYVYVYIYIYTHIHTNCKQAINAWIWVTKDVYVYMCMYICIYMYIHPRTYELQTGHYCLDLSDERQHKLGVFLLARAAIDGPDSCRNERLNGRCLRLDDLVCTCVRMYVCMWVCMHANIQPFMHTHNNTCRCSIWRHFRPPQLQVKASPRLRADLIVKADMKRPENGWNWIITRLWWVMVTSWMRSISRCILRLFDVRRFIYTHT